MIEVQLNIFHTIFGVQLNVRNEKKGVSRMRENVYLSIKSPKASRTQLSGPLTLTTENLTSLACVIASLTTSATFGL